MTRKCWLGLALVVGLFATAPKAHAGGVQVCEIGTSTAAATMVTCAAPNATDITLVGIEYESVFTAGDYVACFSSAGAAGLAITSEGTLTAGVVASARIQQASNDTGKLALTGQAALGRDVTGISALTSANGLYCGKSNTNLKAKVLYRRNS